MTYSTKNRAYGRLVKNRADERVKEEAILAAELQMEFRTMSRPEALREAARLVAMRQTEPYR